ncbi:nectin-1-like [Carettochelys insculpta]|uniref:nectin-1-like n=1 Tax=Carettochelys insculpta TaxID=44489 RepID=UPI003EC13A65
MSLQRVWWPELWLTLLGIHSLLKTPCAGANEAVTCERVPPAVVGENVTLKCNFTQSSDVLQVTWQKQDGSSYKNMATYSKAHGFKSTDHLNKRLCFSASTLNSACIIFCGVTLEDEACYKCIFNAFPYGSFFAETCLAVQWISAVSTELQLNISTKGLFAASCSVTAKPAPEITWKPEGILIGQPVIHTVQNANRTVTVTSKVSVMPTASNNHQPLTCIVNHPLGRKETIYPTEEYKGYKEYKASDEESRMYTWQVLCILFFILIAIVVTIIVMVQKKRKWNEEKSSSILSTPGAKKHLKQDGGEIYQCLPTPKSQSISYQNEQLLGSSCKKRIFSESKENQRVTLVPRPIFSDGKEKNMEGTLNYSFTEDFKEMDE